MYDTFLVRMPSGARYWTVMDAELVVVPEADHFLRELRLARGRAETTTKAYAEAVVLYLRWCGRTGREWPTAARDMGLFMLWLRWTPGRSRQRQVVVPGEGTKPVRGDARSNKVLAALRMFLSHRPIARHETCPIETVSSCCGSSSTSGPSIVGNAIVLGVIGNLV